LAQDYFESQVYLLNLSEILKRCTKRERDIYCFLRWRVGK